MNTVASADQGADRSLADLIYEELLGRIVSGQLGPGSHLVEPQLATELHCSRTPLRVALTRLVSEGLVVQHRHRGCFVAQPDARQLREVYQVREVTEGLAAALLAARATLEELQVLAAICEALRDALRRLDMTAYNQEDFRFHRFVVRACGNQCLSQVSHAGALVLLSFLVPVYFEPLSAQTPWPASEPVDAHFTIYQAIAARDVAAAEETMRQHIRGAASAVGVPLTMTAEEVVMKPLPRLGGADS